MDIVVANANPGVPLWSHFLLNRWDVTVEERGADSATIATQRLALAGDSYRATLNDATTSIRLTATATCVMGTKSYLLLALRQEFAIASSSESLQPMGWKKGPPSDPIGLHKGIPSLHPLLSPRDRGVALNVRFVDITDLFNDLHGGSAWLRALNLVRRRTQTLRVIASLGGHPLVWHVVIPDVCGSLPEVRPAVMVMPYDYGAISYENSMRGLKSSNHGVSRGTIQSGLEILTRMLLEPLSDDHFRRTLSGYVSLRKAFSGAAADLPPLFTISVACSHTRQVSGMCLHVRNRNCQQTTGANSSRSFGILLAGWSVLSRRSDPCSSCRL